MALTSNADSRGTPALFSQMFGVFCAAAGLSTLHVGLSRLLAYVLLQAQALVVMSCAPFALALGVALMAKPERSRQPLSPGKLSLLTELLVLACLVLCSQVTIPFLITVQPASVLPLPLFGLLVLLPFMFAGRLLIAPITRDPAYTGPLAAAGFCGVALAAALSTWLVRAAGTPGMVALSALWFALSSAAFARRGSRARAGTLTFAIALTCIGLTGWLEFPCSERKGLSVLVKKERASLAYKRWTPLERIDVLRFDPPRQRGGLVTLGAGRQAVGGMPGHYIIARDGDPAAALYEWDGVKQSLGFFEHHLLRAPYLLAHAPRALALQAVGNMDALVAVANDVQMLQVAVASPALREVGQEAFRSFSGGIFAAPQVHVTTVTGRALLRAETRYDLISLHWARTQVPLGLGMLDLSENYLQTREALGGYLSRLRPGGVLAISLLDQGRKRTPSHHLRLLRTVHRALRDRGASHPAEHVVVLSSGKSRRLIQILVQDAPISASSRGVLAQYAAQEGFDFGAAGRVPHVLARHLSAADLVAASRRPIASDDLPFFFDVDLAKEFWSTRPYQSLAQVRLPALSPEALVISVWVGLLNVGLVALWVFLRLLIDRRMPDILRPLGSMRGSAWLFFFAAQGVVFALLTLGVIHRLATAEYQVTAGMERLFPALMVGCALGAVVHVHRHGFLEAWLRLLALAVGWFVLRGGGARWFEQFEFDADILWVPLIAGALTGGFVTFGIRHLFRDIRWAPPAIAAALWGLGFGHSVGVLVAARVGFSALPLAGLAVQFSAMLAVYGAHSFVRLRRRAESLRPPAM